MGLDMFFYKESKSEKTAPVEVMYYRKHHDLHGWLNGLYNQKHHDSPDYNPKFNCVRLYLTKDDLSQLRQDIIDFKLPHTDGFFFGDNPPDADSNKTDLETVKRLLSILDDDDNSVFYEAWY